MIAQHTPEPWTFETPTSGRIDEDVAFWIRGNPRADDGEVLAQVNHRTVGDETAAANARLICTAPAGLTLARAIVLHYRKRHHQPLLASELKLRELAVALIDRTLATS